MIPSSDQLESFLERLTSLDRELSRLRGAEVRKAETIAEIKAVCRDWLRFSEALRAVEALPYENLNLVDDSLQDIFQSTNARTRSSAYRKKLAPVLTSFTDRIVVPVIRFEGSPSQVASRQLLSEFTGKVSPDEQAYLEEAARCLASRCNRAAIIMLWAAAISRLHRAIEKIGFNAYNAALDKTYQRKGNPFNRVSKTPVTSLPELQRCRDFDLIVVGMELWKYDIQVFEELDRLLGMRNSAAHPGMLKPSALDVQQFASKVSTYVFSVVTG
ncbi:MAG: hypothetical protein RX316_06200 [bacterium]|nr:hypothetical protein [bacterium]